MFNQKIQLFVKQPLRSYTVDSRGWQNEFSIHFHWHLLTSIYNHVNNYETALNIVKQHARTFTLDLDFNLSGDCFGTDITQKCKKWFQMGAHGLTFGRICAKIHCVFFMLETCKKTNSNMVKNTHTKVTVNRWFYIHTVLLNTRLYKNLQLWTKRRNIV